MMNGKRIDKIFSGILRDNRSGSSALQARLTESLLALSAVHKLTGDDLLHLKKNLLTFREQILRFPVVVHFVDHLLPGLRDGADPGTLEHLLKQYDKRWKDVNAGIVRHFFENVEMPESPVILLHSNSSSVQCLFREIARGQNAGDYEIIQTESRPVLEGRDQAAFLAREGFSVHLIPDMLVEDMIEEADMVILGADLVTDEVFVNKTGSYLLCTLAEAAEVPVFVLSDSRKRVTADYYEEAYDQIFRDFPAGEVWEEPPAGVKIHNSYFAEVPNALVTAFFTEEDVIEGGKGGF